MKKKLCKPVDDWQFLPGKMGIAPDPAAQYCTLHLAVQRTQDYNPIFLNDHAPCDTRKKYEYLLLVLCTHMQEGIHTSTSSVL